MAYFCSVDRQSSMEMCVCTRKWKMSGMQSCSGLWWEELETWKMEDENGMTEMTRCYQNRRARKIDWKSQSNGREQTQASRAQSTGDNATRSGVYDAVRLRRIMVDGPSTQSSSGRQEGPAALASAVHSLFCHSIRAANVPLTILTRTSLRFLCCLSILNLWPMWAVETSAVMSRCHSPT